MKYTKRDSAIHKIDPRTKLLYLFSIIIFAIYSKEAVFLSLLLILSISLFKLSKLSLRNFFSETKTLLAFLAALFIFQLYLNSPGLAVITILFLLDIFFLTAAFIQTTHPSDLAHSLVNWKIPYELAFLFSLTLRLVPVLQNEMQDVRAAQSSRGHRIRYPWDAIPLAIPMLHKLFKRALDLSLSLGTKAFSGDRAFYRAQSLKLQDYLLISALFASVIFWVL